MKKFQILKYRYVVVAALAMGASWAVGQVNEPPPRENYTDLVDRSMRWPVIGFPMVAKGPTVDGHLDDKEWAVAAWLPDCLNDSEVALSRAGLPTKYRLDVLAQYTSDTLYLGYRMHLPTGVKPIAGGIPEKRDSDKGYGKDVVNFFINPDGGQWTGRGQKYHIVGNALGVMADRIYTDKGLFWDFEWTNAVHRAQLTADGYEGEFSLPLKDVQAANPKPGALWRANFMDGRVGTIAGWCFYNMWNPFRWGIDIEDGWVVMTGRALAARFVHGGNTAKVTPITVEVNGEFPASGVEAEFQLFKRNSMPTPKDPSVLAIFAKNIRQRKENGSATWGNSYASLREMAMKEVKPFGAPIRKTLKPGDNRISAPAITEEGEYLLLYRVSSGKEDLSGLLAAGALPFRIEPDLALTVKPHLLMRGTVMVETDMMNLPRKDQAKEVRVTVSSPDGKAVGTKSVAVTAANEAVVEIPARDWPVGNYQVLSEVLGADGKPLSKMTTPYERVADPVWWTNKAGMQPEVPPPFEPVKARELGQGKKGLVVDVIRRKYTFEGLPAPASVVSSPNTLSLAEPEPPPVEVLASPIEFRAVVAGREVKWACSEFKVTEQKNTHVTFQTVNEGEGLVLSAETKVEFDGMIFVKFKLGTKDGAAPAALDSLDLVLPFRKEVAQVMYNYRVAPGPCQAATDKSASKGVRYHDKVPDEPRKDVVFYEQFVGNNRVGLEWTCERTKGWRMKRAHEANEVRREKDRVVEVFHMVDYPVKLDSPVEIEFGLMAAPVKPMPKNWGLWRYDEIGGLPPTVGDDPMATSVKRRAPTQEDLDAWKRRAAWTRQNLHGVFWQGWTGTEWNMVPITDEKHAAQLKRKFEICHQAGQRVFLHGGWYCILQALPEFRNWGYEMVKAPPEGSFNNSLIVEYNSPYTDWLIYNIEYNARTVGNDGIRWDTVNVPIECYSTFLDNAWKDENGREWPSVRIWASREMLKRNYRVFHGGAKTNGFSIVCHAGPPILAHCSFADMYHVGEGFFEYESTMKKGYPPMTVRTLMGGGVAHGFPWNNNLKGSKLDLMKRVSALLVGGADPRWAGVGLSSYAYSGYQLGPVPMGCGIETWNAYEWIDRGNSALFRPYWENADVLKQELPRMADGKLPEVYSTFYYQPGKRILLVTANYEEQPLESVAVKLDLPKLGFKADDVLYAEDAVTGEALPFEKGELRFGLFEERHRMVKISRDLPRFHASRLGNNALPLGALDAPPKDGMVLTPSPAAWAQVDSRVKHGGAASLRITKDTPSSADARTVSFTSSPVGAGPHLLDGWVRIEKKLEAPISGNEGPRADAAFVIVNVLGNELKKDRPEEFTWGGGAFAIGEPTPGWYHFQIPFSTTANTKQVGVQVVLTGIGTVWIDDLEVREVRAK